MSELVLFFLYWKTIGRGRYLISAYSARGWQPFEVHHSLN